MKLPWSKLTDKDNYNCMVYDLASNFTNRNFVDPQWRFNIHFLSMWMDSRSTYYRAKYGSFKPQFLLDNARLKRNKDEIEAFVSAMSLDMDDEHILAFTCFYHDILDQCLSVRTQQEPAWFKLHWNGRYLTNGEIFGIGFTLKGMRQPEAFDDDYFRCYDVEDIREAAKLIQFNNGLFGDKSPVVAVGFDKDGFPTGDYATHHEPDFLMSVRMDYWDRKNKYHGFLYAEGHDEDAVRGSVKCLRRCLKKGGSHQGCREEGMWLVRMGDGMGRRDEILRALD